MIELSQTQTSSGGDLQRRSSSQSGATLVEVLIALGLAAVALVPLATWAMISFRVQDESRENNRDTAGVGLAATYFSRDMENSMVAASTTAIDGTPRPASQLKDCIGGRGAGGDVVAAIVTPANRRIVYSVTDIPEGETGRGRALWRRECPNLSAAGDATLDDTFLNAPSGQNPGHIDPSTSGNNGTVVLLSTNVESAPTSCPLSGGTGQDATCTSMKMSARVSATTNKPAHLVVLQGTRRVNAYAPPGTPPVARFTYGMVNDADTLPPERTKLVRFDASTSVDLRGAALTYAWNFGDGTTATGAQANHAFAKSTSNGGVPYSVTLTVTSANGAHQALRVIDVIPVKPSVQVTTPTPITAVQNHAMSISANIQTTDDVYTDQTTEADVTTANFIVSATWDWGDGTAVTSAGCAAGVRTCTPTTPHTYATTGLKVIKLTVTDTLGQVATRSVTVTVRSGIYYVSAAAGDDSATCGNQASPCQSIAHGLSRAQAGNRSQLRVARGTYARFNVVSGINVTGGFSADFATQGASGDRTYINPAEASGVFSGITASGVASTTITGFTINAGGAGAGVPSAAIFVTGNSNNVVFNKVVVNGSSGTPATGVLVQGASIATISESTVTSGATQGAGSSAYGVRVIGTSTVTIADTNVTASNGQPGNNSGAVPGQQTVGCSGIRGGNATGPSSPGGGAASCGSGVQASGGGGRGGDYNGSGGAGGRGSGGTGANGGNGGCGSTFGCGTNAGNGDAGAGGAGGSAGAAGVAAGSFPAAAGPVFAGPTGGAGGGGAVGAGGGGGGGGKSASASGGGGGSGGGGASGGTGATAPGTSGGGSFAIYSHDSVVTVTGTSALTSGNGGAGGQGGTGGQGGNGGIGGGGGDKSCCSAGSGGSGGNGGNGGGGGGAGGGPGGPTVVAFEHGTGTITLVGGGVTLTRGAAGGGGAGGAGGGPGTTSGGGGASGSAGQGGNAGLSYRTYIDGAATT